MTEKLQEPGEIVQEHALRDIKKELQTLTALTEASSRKELREMRRERDKLKVQILSQHSEKQQLNHYIDSLEKSLKKLEDEGHFYQQREQLQRAQEVELKEQLASYTSKYEQLKSLYQSQSKSHERIQLRYTAIMEACFKQVSGTPKVSLSKPLMNAVSPSVSPGTTRRRVERNRTQIISPKRVVLGPAAKLTDAISENSRSLEDSEETPKNAFPRVHGNPRRPPSTTANAIFKLNLNNIHEISEERTDKNSSYQQHDMISTND